MLRRIIRRAARHGRKLGIDGLFMAELAKTVINESKDGYPELDEKKDFILNVLTKEEQAFDKRIIDYCNELLSGKPVEEHKKAYTRFFEVKDTPVRGRQVYYKEDEIKSARKYIGYFAIITNEKMDAFTALHLYRMKDIVEKAFGNLKERLNMRRLLAKSEKNLDGKIFNEFIALILISHLDHKMKETDLYKTYTMQQLLDKLDVLECYENEKRMLRIGELLDKQAEIYKTLGVEPPTSSC